MKIFNWVHRRFNHKADGLAQDEKKSGLMMNADESSHDDKQLLHENNALSNVLDGWKGGILTIGTFGYDALKHEMEQNDAPFFGQELRRLPALGNDERQITDSEEEDDEEGEEENPLVYAAYEHDYEGLMGMKVEGNCGVSTKEEIEIEFEFEFDGISMMKSTKKERTTLAELFSADSEELQKKQPLSKGEVIKENKPNYKHGFSFAKKLKGDQDVRPIHKLHRLMRRMLRRKIHPDVQGVHKQNPPVDNSGKVVAKKCETATTESASLLPTLTPVADAII